MSAVAPVATRGSRGREQAQEREGTWLPGMLQLQRVSGGYSPFVPGDYFRSEFVTFENIWYSV